MTHPNPLPPGQSPGPTGSAAGFGAPGYGVAPVWGAAAGGYGPVGYGQQQAAPPVAEGGGYPCDPRDGDLFIVGLGPVRRAGMGRRLLARLLDWLVILLIMGLAGATMALAVHALGGFSGEKPPPIAIVFILLMVLMISLFPWGYEIFLTARYGATVGKTITGITVVRLTDGRRPGTGVSFMRVLVPFGAAMVSGVGHLLVYLSPVFDRSPARQGWHDVVAKTMVIRRR